MNVLPLVRSGEDRRRYELADVGAMHVAGAFGGDQAVIVTAGGSWECGKAAMIGGALKATGASQTVDGRFEPSFLGGGGTLSWGRVEYTIRPIGLFSTGYRLQHAGTPLWEFHPRALSGGKRPMDAARLAPGVADEVVMFAVYIARSLVASLDSARAGSPGSGPRSAPRTDAAARCAAGRRRRETGRVQHAGYVVPRFEATSPDARPGCPPRPSPIRNESLIIGPRQRAPALPHFPSPQPANRPRR